MVSAGSAGHFICVYFSEYDDFVRLKLSLNLPCWLQRKGNFVSYQESGHNRRMIYFKNVSE